MSCKVKALSEQCLYFVKISSWVKVYFPAKIPESDETLWDCFFCARVLMSFSHFSELKRCYLRFVFCVKAVMPEGSPTPLSVVAFFYPK